jgi:hypothetical protein
VKVSPPETVTGTELSALELFPSSPYEFPPQQYAAPLVLMAQVCGPPALTVVNASEFGGGGGGGLVELLLSPPHAAIPSIAVSANTTPAEDLLAARRALLTAGGCNRCCGLHTTERCIVAS